MRNVFLIFFISVCQAYALDAYSQNRKLNLNMNQVPLASVLERIEDNSEYFFLYNAKLVDVKREVSITAENEEISKILSTLFAGTGVSYKILDRRIILSPGELTSSSESIQQQMKVTGKVTDSSGAPLPGVSVVIKNTTTGTITNFDGKYTLANVSSDAMLVFSFVGMKTQELPVAGKTVMNVTMAEETVGIEEVVAVGYGSMKKKDLTGSVASAKIETFRESPNLSISQSLQGALPGLNVGQVDMAGEDPSISIRGQNSLSGSQNPLIVLDGVIYHGNIIDLNPNDIKSIDLLKDASSTAIYGSRAANGVLIITTKTGKSGGKPVITLSSSYSFQNPASYLKGMTRDEYINKNYDVDWKRGYLAPDYTQKNPDFDPTKGWSRTNVYRGYLDDIEFDWWKSITQTPSIQNHTLSMQESTEKTSYFLSAGYTDQKGLMLNDFYNRWSFRTNFNSNITEWFSAGVQSFVSTSDYSGVNASATNLWTQSPLVTPYDENGNLVRNPSGSIETNPLLVLKIDDLDKNLNLFASAYATIKIPQLPGLSYKLNFSDNYIARRQYQFDKNGNSDTGAAYKKHSIQNIWAIDNLLTYDNTFGDHKINVTLLSGREERKADATNATGGNFLNMVLGYHKLEASSAEKQLSFSDAWSESSLYYMGRFHYGYKGKYLATLTVRRDGFSGFAVGRKFGVFPSGAVAWILSEESFMDDEVSWVDLLKIRASYGENGNRTAGRYSTLAQVSSQQEYLYGDGASPAIGQYINNMANTSLSWETTKGLNLGLDFSVLNHRIKGTVDYYNSNTHDVLYNVNIPIITGYGSILTNIGKIHNHGIEFTISSSNVKTNNFKWDTDVNFSLNRNRVVSILGIDDDKDGREDDLVASKLFIGEDINSVYDYEITGIYQLDDEIPAGYSPGLYKVNDLNEDGKITPDLDRKILGRTTPSFRFSVNNEFSYKNWMLKVFVNSIQGGKKGYMANNDPNTGGWFWGANVAGAYDGNLPNYNYWTPANPNAEYRTLGAIPPVYAGSYRQRSFIRLQDISLAYRFDKRVLNKLGIVGLKLYVSGKNLATITKWKGVDPETGQGYTPNQTPVMKSYTMGLELSF